MKRIFSKRTGILPRKYVGRKKAFDNSYREELPTYSHNNHTYKVTKRQKIISDSFIASFVLSVLPYNLIVLKLFPGINNLHFVFKILIQVIFVYFILLFILFLFIKESDKNIISKFRLGHTYESI